MRNFFCRLVKNMMVIYICLMGVLSYRLIYNEMYYEIHEDMQVSSDKGILVYPSGKIVGIYTECEGIFVIDTCEIENSNGEFVDPAGDVIQTGDYILAIDGNELENKEEMIEVVENSNGDTLNLTISREDDIINVDVTPVNAKNGDYMLGIWVKDDLAGVGTITYFTEDGDFAALGHGMGNGETEDLLKVKGGDIYVSNIIGIEKGKKGDPGEIKGVIYYGYLNHLGEVSANIGDGIYGTLDVDTLDSYSEACELYEIGYKQSIQEGPAQILSEVSGVSKLYDIEITYVDYLASNSKKGLHIEVTDTELIELTGGIVQGMSGSPIIQNGKIVGAVTHVLINNPTRGYGIFIENMIKF